MKKLIHIFFFFSTICIFAQANNQVPNLQQCSPTGIATFDLTTNTPFALAGLDAFNFVVSYHVTQVDAANGTNAIIPATGFANMSNPQVIYIRIFNIATSEVTIKVFVLIVNENPFVQDVTYTACDTDNDGFVSVDSAVLTSIMYQSSPSSTNNYVTNFYATMVDAQTSANSIISPLVIPALSNQVFYAKTQNTMGCDTISTVTINAMNCNTTSCDPPTALSIGSITQTSATASWTASSGATQYEIYLAPQGATAPDASSVGMATSLSNYTITGLTCGTTYQAYVRTNCSQPTNFINASVWSNPVTFTLTNCAATAVNLTACSENGVACFDLTTNTPVILGNLDPTIYSVSYFPTYADASLNTNVITNPTQYCTQVGSSVVYASLSSANTPNQIVGFYLYASAYNSTAIVLTDMQQCDDNNDTSVTFNLTAIQAQINTSNTLQYYTSLVNAQNQTVPITNPTTFTVGTQTPITTIFVREIITNSCDSIYSFRVKAYAVCNNAYTCSAANSLCSALGVPFVNTHQNIPAESGNAYGCLTTSPNPTWFYMPISGAGNINLLIQQSTTINFVTPNLDVDYICYGPFTSPVLPCSGQLTANKIVCCSYSAAATESPIIPNAQPGEYYLIMVTNFSNQAGFIKITELPTTQGALNCSGFRLNAFLDTNANGTQEVGEQNFPLGQFHYEVNTNGDIHNVIAPTGVYNLYDINPTNSYNLSFTVDSNYTMAYGVTTASYSNVHIVVGMGMQTYNFPITVIQTYNDLAITIIPTQQPRPGFTYQNMVVYANLGNQTIPSGTINFQKDALVTITANSQTGATSTITGFTYDFTNLLPFEYRIINVTMAVPQLPTVALGDHLINSATIVPFTGDIVPENNSTILNQTIIGSYDPNDKVESHGGRILFSDFTSEDYLYYTIHFENTGTASAVNVKVIDVLDAKLDETSIKMVSASHNYTMDRIDNSLTWNFENIQLPGTLQNPSASNGYITFKIKPKTGYAVGDIIPNTAAIYFDYNPAIITNTFQTEFTQLLGTTEFENVNFVFYPNPASDLVTVSLKNNVDSIAKIVVYDVLGKTIAMVNPTNETASQTIDLTAVETGIYLIEVTTNTNMKVIKKLIVK